MLIIKNGTVVGSNKTEQLDIKIDKGIIIEVNKEIEVMSNDEVIDAAGQLVFPGFIDGHTHMEMDAGSCMTADSFATGSKAAIINGTTTLVDFATQDKGKTLKEAYDTWMSRAEGTSSCDFRFHMAITDWNEATRKEIATMPDLGVSSFKMYMAYSNLWSNDAQILEALKEIKKIDGGVLGVHCENGVILDEMRNDLATHGHLDPSAHPLSRPDVVEAEAINRLAYIGSIAEHPVQVVHLSSAAGLHEIREARKKGIELTVETCPQYLLLEDSVYSLPDFEGAKYVMSPPLRKKEDQVALLEAIKQREIDTLATDHCSFHWKDKLLGKDDFRKIPNGGPGIEHRPQLMYTKLVEEGHIDVSHFCELMCENPARRYGMFPQKGIIQVGSDADIVIWNPSSESVISAKTQLQNVEYTPYEGMHVKGSASTVLLHGEIVVEHGKIVNENRGKYVFGGKGIY